MDPFMEHYPYCSHNDVMEILKRHPNTTKQDMERHLIVCVLGFEGRFTTPGIVLRMLEDVIRHISICRETTKQKGRKHITAGPLLHLHSLHVQPKEALNGRPFFIYGTVRVKYRHIDTGEEVHLDVYRRSAKEAEYISPESDGNLVLFRPDISPDWIGGIQDFWMQLQGTTIEVDLYQKIGESTHLIAQDNILVESTTQGDVEELRSKEFQHSLCSATLSYIKMPFAALCELTVRFSSKNKGLVLNISGKVVVRYKNTCGNYNSEPCILFEKQDGFVSVKMEKLKSRKLLGVPAYSSLEVEIDMVDVNKNKPIKGKLNILNEDIRLVSDCVVDVDGDFAIILNVALIPHAHWLGVHCREYAEGWSLLNRYDLDPKFVLQPSSFAEFYSIFIGRKKMGPTLNIIGTVELSSGSKTHYLFKRVGDDGVEIEDSQNVLPLGDVHMILDDYLELELKVDLKDVGGKFQSKGFALHDRTLGTQICSVFPGEGGFCALHYSIFSRAFLAKIEIFIKNKGDHFGPDIVYGSSIAHYSKFEYLTEFERNYFRSVLFKRTEKDSVRLKDDGRVPLSRCVVAVPLGSSLIIHIDLFGTHYHLSCDKVFEIGSSSFNKLENDHDLDIKLTWSDGSDDGGNDSNNDKVLMPDCKMGGVNQTKTREQPDQLNGESDLDEDEDCPMGVVEQMKTSVKRKRPDHHSGWCDLEKDEALRIAQELATRLESSQSEQTRRMEEAVSLCRKEAVAAQPEAVSLKGKVAELTKGHQTLRAQCSAAEARSRELEEAARQSADRERELVERVAQLERDLKAERSNRLVNAATAAAQTPEQFVELAIPDRDTGIRFFQALNKHPVSEQLLTEIGTYGFELGQHKERAGTHACLQRKIRNFKPADFGLEPVPEYEPLAPFPGL